MRFISINDRKYESIIHEFPVNYVGKIASTKRTKFTWKNLTLMKDPMVSGNLSTIFPRF